MIAIREFNEGDKNFIYATMLNGLYYGCPLYHEIEKEAFFENYHKVIQNLLSQPSIRLAVACLEIDEEVVLGYRVSSSEGLLHFIYVKREWRSKGIATMLLQGCSEISSVTHITELGNKIRKKKGWVYNPFLL